MTVVLWEARTDGPLRAVLPELQALGPMCCCWTSTV